MINEDLTDDIVILWNSLFRFSYLTKRSKPANKGYSKIVFVTVTLARPWSIKIDNCDILFMSLWYGKTLHGGNMDHLSWGWNGKTMSLTGKHMKLYVKRTRFLLRILLCMMNWKVNSLYNDCNNSSCRSKLLRPKTKYNKVQYTGCPKRQPYKSQRKYKNHFYQTRWLSLDKNINQYLKSFLLWIIDIQCSF